MSNTPYVAAGYWQPGYSEGDENAPDPFPLSTVASQYANSPSIMQLIGNLNQQIDPSPLFARFVQHVWDIDTAQGFGLDILGRLVGLPRELQNVRPIFPQSGLPGTVAMNDDQYRRALLIQAWSNIGDHSFSGINYGMRIMANGRGNAFASKLGTMMIRYNFFYGPEAYEYALINSGDVLIRPVAVGFDRLTKHPYFGFSEAQSWDTFGQSPFAAY